MAVLGLCFPFLSLCPYLHELGKKEESQVLKQNFGSRYIPAVSARKQLYSAKQMIKTGLPSPTGDPKSFKMFGKNGIISLS